VGPLDERFFLFFEDTDLSRRLADRGLASVVVSEATMLHHGHSTVARPEFGSAMERQMLRSRYLYYRKHFGRRQAAVSMLIVKAELIARAAKLAVLGSVRGRPDERHKRDLLLSLVRSDPKSPLAHETSAVSGVVCPPPGEADRW
jgi:GT2 family glycosyltransferase